MRIISCFVVAALHGNAFSAVSVGDACTNDEEVTCKQERKVSEDDPEVASMMQLKRYEAEGSGSDEAFAMESEESMVGDEDEDEDGNEDEDSTEEDEFADEGLNFADEEDESADEEEDSAKQDLQKTRVKFHEKCCRCSNGFVYFSRTGDCDQCHGSVEKVRRVGKKCRVSNHHFKGDKWCNQKCESGMKLHFPRTREKCCKCEDGRIGYSMEGGCTEYCHGHVRKQRNVVGKCKAESHEFKGESWCHAKCHDTMKVLLDLGTVEKCCECKHGAMGWSANGDCDFCFGDVEKKKNVPRKCKRTHANFKGEHWCNEKCEHKLKGH